MSTYDSRIFDEPAKFTLTNLLPSTLPANGVSGGEGSEVVLEVQADSLRVAINALLQLNETEQIMDIIARILLGDDYLVTTPVESEEFINELAKKPVGGVTFEATAEKDGKRFSMVLTAPSGLTAYESFKKTATMEQMVKVVESLALKR